MEVGRCAVVRGRERKGCGRLAVLRLCCAALSDTLTASSASCPARAHPPANFPSQGDPPTHRGEPCADCEHRGSKQSRRRVSASVERSMRARILPPLVRQLTHRPLSSYTSCSSAVRTSRTSPKSPSLPPRGIAVPRACAAVELDLQTGVFALVRRASRWRGRRMHGGAQ
jgi:hypothetical protein